MFSISKSQINNSKLRTRNSELETQNPKLRTRNSEPETTYTFYLSPLLAVPGLAMLSRIEVSASIFFIL